MKLINRCIVSLTPKQPLMDWVKSLETIETPDIWDFEGGAYLYDEHETEEALLKDIHSKAATMMRNELSAWTEDDSLWPNQPNYDLMVQWFHIHMAVAGFDLGKEPLLRANLDDLL